MPTTIYAPVFLVINAKNKTVPSRHLKSLRAELRREYDDIPPIYLPIGAIPGLAMQRSTAHTQWGKHYASEDERVNRTPSAEELRWVENTLQRNRRNILRACLDDIKPPRVRGCILHPEVEFSDSIKWLLDGLPEKNPLVVRPQQNPSGEITYEVLAGMLTHHVIPMRYCVHA